MQTYNQCELKIKNLSHSFGQFRALHDINACFKKGSLTAIIGPNGGGKSTLVKCITGQYKPTKGSINFIGVAPTNFSYVPQKTSLDTTFPITVHEVAAMGFLNRRNLHKNITRADLDKLDTVLEDMGLKQQRDQLVETLSGGQFQRLLFSRLFLQDQPLVILDEPFSHIDEKTKEILLNIIQKWHKLGKTIIVILHELDLVKKYFPETMLMAKQMIAFGETKDVLSEKNIADAFRKVMEAE